MNKQQIIICVGADMTGKTQIAKALSARLSIPYFKASGEHKTYLKENDMFLQQLRHADPRLIDFLKQTGYSVVMDRGYPCEKVYSKVLSRQTDYVVLQDIDEKFADLGALIIICRRKSYEGITDDLDVNLNSSKLAMLDAAYEKFRTWTSCKCLTLWVDDEDLDRELNEITEWLNNPTHKCCEVIPNTFISCGEGDNFCSTLCQKEGIKQ